MLTYPKRRELHILTPKMAWSKCLISAIASNSISLHCKRVVKRQFCSTCKPITFLQKVVKDCKHYCVEQISEQNNQHKFFKMKVFDIILSPRQSQLSPSVISPARVEYHAAKAMYRTVTLIVPLMGSYTEISSFTIRLAIWNTFFTKHSSINILGVVQLKLS